MRTTQPAALLGRRTAHGHAAFHAAHGLPAALWAVLGLAALIALAVWAVGRGRHRPGEDAHTYRESIRPLDHTQPHSQRPKAPPPGVRRAYATALAALDRAGLLAAQAHPAATPHALLQTVSTKADATLADPSESGKLREAVGAFARLTALYCQVMYAAPDRAGPAQTTEGTRTALELAARIRVAVRTRRARRGSGASRGNA